MIDTVVCPNCQRTLARRDDAFGREMQCPSCQTLFRASHEPQCPPAVSSQGKAVEILPFQLQNQHPAEAEWQPASGLDDAQLPLVVVDRSVQTARPQRTRWLALAVVAAVFAVLGTSLVIAFTQSDRKIPSPRRLPLDPAPKKARMVADRESFAAANAPCGRQRPWTVS